MILVLVLIMDVRARAGGGVWVRLDPQLRHGYFDINRMIVDDARELMLTRRRAGHRRNVVRREAHVFTFMAVPMHIVND